MAYYHHRTLGRRLTIHFFPDEYHGNDDRTLYERVRQLRREILPDLSGWFRVRQIHGRRASGALHRRGYFESDRKRESHAGASGYFDRLHMSHLRRREPVRRHIHGYSDRAAPVQGGGSRLASLHGRIRIRSGIADDDHAPGNSADPKYHAHKIYGLNDDFGSAGRSYGSGRCRNLKHLVFPLHTEKVQGER